MEIITVDAVIRKPSEEKILRIINLGPLPLFKMDYLEPFLDLTWPLDTIPQSQEELAKVLFKPTESVINMKNSFTDMADLLKFINIETLLTLDSQERVNYLNKLIYPKDDETFAFLAPVYKSKKERKMNYILNLVARPALGCEHMESTSTFCKKCEISENLCRKCNKAECQCWQGKQCDCGARFLTEKCCCGPAEIACLVCKEAILGSEQAVNTSCGCQCHYYCYADLLQHRYCEKCQKLAIPAQEFAFQQLSAFLSFCTENKPKLSDSEHIVLYSYKCQKCSHLSVDTSPFMCHSCCSLQLSFVEFIEISVENAAELFKNDFVGEIGGAVQLFCNWAAPIFVLYDKFLKFGEDEEEFEGELLGEEE